MPTLRTWVGLKKLEIRVPEFQKLFIWSCGDAVSPITAKDEDEAFRKVIAHRMNLLEGTEQERLQEALRWYRKNDTLLQVDCDEMEVEPYQGEIPDEA